MTPSAHVDALRERGFTVLPAVCSSAWVAQCRDTLGSLRARLGSPALSSHGSRQDLGALDASVSSVGLTIGKILRHAPELADGFLAPEVGAVLRDALGDGLRVETTGATISDADRVMHPWHHHVGGLDEDLPEIELAEVPSCFRRITALTYLQEVEPRTGQLLVMPRALADDRARAHAVREAWPGQVAVACPAGSTVLVDERTWHAGLPRTIPGQRMFVGAYFVSGDVPPARRVDDSAEAITRSLFARAAGPGAPSAGIAHPG